MNNQTTTAPMTDDELALIRSADARDSATEAGRRSPAVRDRERLLGEVDRLRALLATIRTHQVAAVVGTYVSMQIDDKRRNDRPITHALADSSMSRFRGALAVLQDLLADLGEIEGDEECEAAWEVVQAEMEAAEQK